MAGSTGSLRRSSSEAKEKSNVEAGSCRCRLCVCGRIGRWISVLFGGCCWYFFSFRLISLCFYLIFRSVKKFSFEGIKLVFSRLDARLTRRVLGSQAFLRLTRSSLVPYTNLVSSDATHTLLHDQQTRRISGLLVSQGRSAVRRFSRSVMPWR